MLEGNLGRLSDLVKRAQSREEILNALKRLKREHNALDANVSPSYESRYTIRAINTLLQRFRNKYGGSLPQNALDFVQEKLPVPKTRKRPQQPRRRK